MNRLLLSLILLIAVTFAWAPSVWAIGSTGFENASYSARSIAQGNAAVARPDEPDAVVFNPAGLPDLKGIQISGGFAGINTHTWFTSKITGGREKNTPQLALVPNSYLTVNPGKILGDRVGAGVGVNAPFGLLNRYESTGIMARYTGHRNYLNMVAVTIAGGFKLHDKFSVGGGAVSYNVYKYDQYANFPNSNILAPVVGPNTFPDGLARVEMEGSGWGWTLGALLKPAEKHRLGFYYRSRATVDVDGDLKIENINPLLQTIGVFPTIPNFQTRIRSEVPLPSNITLGYAYVPSDKWSIEFDWGYTRWSVFKDQDVAFSNPNAVLRALGVVPRDYDDTMSYHLGGHYKIHDRLDLYAGTFFFGAASPKGHVDNVIPDSDRLSGTIGFRWNMTKNIDIDVAYLGIYHVRREIANGPVFAKNGLNIDGRYTGFTQEFMINFTYRFDFPFGGSSEPSMETAKSKE